MEGIGSTQLWSFVPAVDFTVLSAETANCKREENTEEHTGGRDEGSVEENLKFLEIKDPGEDEKQDAVSEPPLNVLLVGAGDICHVVRTIARAWRREGSRNAFRKLNFYILESQAPILARHILLLSILLDEHDDMGLEERAQLFLEIYANCFLREKTYDYVKERSKGMIRLITDAAGPLAPLFDFTSLRFRERDDLEFVFNFWRNDQRSFDMEKMRDQRMMRFYDLRYDSRDNVADYDYHMNLCDKASIIHKREFVKWRLTGVAHEVRDSNYVKPNRTMATVQGLKESGLTVPKWGFFSDISVGPFFSYGVQTEATELLKKRQENHMHFSQEVAEHNVCSYIHEMNTASLYNKDDPNRICLDEEKPVPRPSSFAKIHFLPCDPSVTFEKRRNRYVGTFDKIYLGSGMAHRIGEVVELLKGKHQEGQKRNDEVAEIIVENVRYIVDLTKTQSQEYVKRVMAMAREAGLHAQLPKQSPCTDGKLKQGNGKGKDRSDACGPKEAPAGTRDGHVLTKDMDHIVFQRGS